MASKNGELSLGQDKTGSKALQLASSSSRGLILLAAGIIIIAGLLAYHNSFGGPSR